MTDTYLGVVMRDLETDDVFQRIIQPNDPTAMWNGVHVDLVSTSYGYRAWIVSVNPPTHDLSIKPHRPAGRATEVSWVVPVGLPPAWGGELRHPNPNNLVDGVHPKHAMVDHRHTLLDGGSGLMFDFVEPGKQPWNVRNSYDGVAREILGCENPPFQFTRRSLNEMFSTRGKGTLGHHFLSAYQNNRAIGHVQRYGDAYWGDGRMNNHYDPLAHVLTDYLVNGDPDSLHLAYFMWTQHLQTGVIWGFGHGAPFGPFVNQHRYEKGEWPGDFRHPEPSHEWDAGLFAAYELFKDPALEAWCENRIKYLHHIITTPELWDQIWEGRSANIRRWGWFLKNLKAATRSSLWNFTTDVDALVDRVKQHVRSQCANYPYVGVAEDQQPRQIFLFLGELAEFGVDVGEWSRDLLAHMPDDYIPYRVQSPTGHVIESGFSSTTLGWSIKGVAAGDADKAGRMFREVENEMLTFDFDQGRYYDSRVKVAGAMAHGSLDFYKGLLG